MWFGLGLVLATGQVSSTGPSAQVQLKPGHLQQHGRFPPSMLPAFRASLLLFLPPSPSSLTSFLASFLPSFLLPCTYIIAEYSR